MKPKDEDKPAKNDLVSDAEVNKEIDALRKENESEEVVYPYADLPN